MAAILQFPFAEKQMRAMRGQPGGSNLDGDVSTNTQEATELAAFRDKKKAEEKQLSDDAPKLMEILEPVGWRQKGSSLSLYFAAKKETVKALAADRKKAVILFSALQAVIGERRWDLGAVVDFKFDPGHCLLVVFFTIEEPQSGPHGETEEDLESHKYLKPGVNNDDFKWRYVFKKSE